MSAQRHAGAGRHLEAPRGTARRVERPDEVLGSTWSRGMEPGEEVDMRAGRFHRMARTRWQRWRARTHGPGHGPLVHEAMRQEVRRVGLHSPLREAAWAMRDADSGLVPVVDVSGRLRGVVTDRELVLRVLGRDVEAYGLEVADVMSVDVPALTPGASLLWALEVMAHEQVHRLPVVEPDGRLVGMLTLADVAHLARHEPRLQEALARMCARSAFWTRHSG